MLRHLISLFIGFFFISLMPLYAAAQSCPKDPASVTKSGIAFQGRILKPSGEMINGTAKFDIKVYGESSFMGDGTHLPSSPNTAPAERCLLYTEYHPCVDVSEGKFSIYIGHGSQNRFGVPNLQIQKIFINPTSDIMPFEGNRKASSAIPAISCSVGTSNMYLPEYASRNRILEVIATLASGEKISLGEMEIGSVPFSLQAQEISGYGVQNILKTNSQTNKTYRTMSESHADFLFDLFEMDASSVNVNALNLRGKAIKNVVTDPADLSSVASVDYVNQKAQALTAVGTAGTYAKVTTDAYGRVISGTTLVPADIPNLDFSKITTGLPTTLAGYGITDAVLNAGGTPSISQGLDAAKGSASVAGRIYVATDTFKIFRANGSTWDTIGGGTESDPMFAAWAAGSQAANTIYAGPNGSAGAPTFRAMVESDVPSLSTGKLTTGILPIARGGTGLSSYGNNSVIVSNATGSGLSSLNCTPGQTLVFDASGFVGCGAGATGGTVTSVTAGAGLAGGTIATAGTISLAPIANGQVLANASGSMNPPGATTVSALLDAGIGNTQGQVLFRNGTAWVPLAPGTPGQVLKSGGPTADVAWGPDDAGTGTVSSVSMTVPTFMGVTGSPLTTSGTLGISFNSQAANQFFASPNGSAGAPVFRGIAAADLPLFTGSRVITTSTSGALQATTCPQNEVISFDGSGNWSCRSLATLGAWLTTGNAATATDFIGTTNAQDLVFRTNNVNRMRVTASGNVGINSTPRSALDVNGTILGKPAVLNSTSTIDFLNGNKQTSSNQCGAYNLHNLKDGGSYTFVVLSGIPNTCVFSAFSDAGVTPLIVTYPVDHAATAGSTITIYNFIVVGTRVLTAWTSVR